MANTKIRGLTLEINGDTTGLTKSLSKVNSEVKTTEKELKDVEKLLKLNPTNTELLAQKQKLLSDRVSETSKKLNTLKDTQAEFIKQGGDVKSSGYMALEREIIATEGQLKQAQKEANNFNANLEKVNATMGKVSSGAQKVADATKGLSAVGASVAVGLVGLGINSAKTADELNTLAKQTGLTTEEIQKFQYASDLVDVSVEDITSALKKMKNNMSGQADAWARLGIATTNANGELRDATDVFYETLEALSKVANETERDTLAMSLFGKNADTLSGIIDDGGEALKRMGDQAEALGLILDQDTLNELNGINDTMDEMKARFKMTFTQTGAKILQELAPIIEKVADGFAKVAEFIGNLGGDKLEAILKIAAAVAMISPVASLIAKITTGLQALQPILLAINTAILANPMVAIITAIGVAVAALVVLIIKHWDDIKAVLATVASWINEKVITPVVNFFNNLWNGLKNGAKSFANFFIGVINKAIDGVNTIIRGINKIQVKMPSWLGGQSFGFNIGTIGKLPMLANGGRLASGSAIVGERGAELLTMQGGQAVVRPLTNGGGNSGGGINIVLNNTFNGYTSAQGAAMGRDLAYQVNVALGRAY